LVYFILYLFIEVMVSNAFANVLGGVLVFFEIIITAVLGIFILKNFKFSLMQSINDARMGNITQEEFIKTNVAKAMGAVLLIVPGFFTDILGIALQFGILTMLFSKIFHFKKPDTHNMNSGAYNQHTQSQFDYTNNTSYKRREDEEIIDVEIIDDYKSVKH
jgi:UPF0716 protein FxsA